MNAKEKLDRKLLQQDFSQDPSKQSVLDRYRHIAAGYAELENNIAVLSDMQQNISYVYSGRFASLLGLKVDLNECILPSIWEDYIMRLIHPEDLPAKHAEELMFNNYVRKLPRNKIGDHYLMSQLRMKTPTLGYVPVLHKMFYIPDVNSNSLWLALCLYGPLTFEIPMKCCVTNSVDGSVIELKRENAMNILTPRERQILGLIEKGHISKDIADILNISKNTVSRHRQEILAKLQVRNSIEACQVARLLKLI